MTAPPNTEEPIAQASAIPFRRDGERIEFCLITSLKRRRWIFPKGIIDPGESAGETALKEAREEAGLHGRIVGAPLGTYRYAKWGTTLEVTVLLMQVDRSDPHWEESHLRQRRWVSADETVGLLTQEELVDFVKKAIRTIPHASRSAP